MSPVGQESGVRCVAASEGGITATSAGGGACATRNLAVLDLEMIPCPDAIANAGRHARAGYDRPALGRVVCASVLCVEERPDGFGALDLRTFDERRTDEAGIVGFVDLVLPDPAEAASRLVTYNGSWFDLRVLRHRACANWLFGVRNLAGWCGGVGDHVDLLASGFGRGRVERWSLSDLCAGLGLAIRPGLLGRSVVLLHGEGRMDAVVEHNRMDVIGTFLAYAYLRSFETGDERLVASAWDGIARLMDGVPTVNVGMEVVSRHHLVDVARSRLTGPGPSA